MRYKIGGCVLLLGYIWIMLCTDWFVKPLSNEQAYQAAQECRKAELQIYVIARNYQGDAVETACRGFD